VATKVLQFLWLLIGLLYHVYAKEKKEEGKKREKRGEQERIQNFLDI
jgi:preprotein translocase subunit SecG